jgi:hypothetical protein
MISSLQRSRSIMVACHTNFYTDFQLPNKQTDYDYPSLFISTHNAKQYTLTSITQRVDECFQTGALDLNQKSQGKT